LGWADCKISFFFAVDTLDVFIDVQGLPLGAAAVPSDEYEAFYEKSKAALLANFNKVPFAGGFCRSKEEFIAKLNDNNNNENNKTDNTHNGAVPFAGVGVHFASAEWPGVLDHATSKPTLRSVDNKLHLFKIAFYPEDICVHQLHRRAEWLLHFFIDACSAITYDTRWRVLLAYVKQDLSTWPTSQPAANMASRPGVKRSFAEMQAQSDDPSKRSSSSSSCCEERPYRWALVGFASLYKFFALPRCRRRLSQFFVMPTYQKSGLGKMMLKVVHEMTIKDADVMELCVEDPALAFRQLRDVTSVEVAVDAGVVDPKHLFPHEDEQDKDLTSDFEELKWRLRKETKESKLQAARVCDLLHLCRILPHPLPPPPSAKILVGESSSSSVEVCSREWRPMCITPSGSDESNFAEGERVKCLRLSVKKKLRQEQIELLSGMKANKARQELSEMWKDVYTTMYRSVKKLREIHHDALTV